MSDTDLAALRREYESRGLAEADLDADPCTQLEKWLAAAIDAELVDATAMALATVSGEGRPSARIVLLKGIEQGALVFFTRYSTQKGLDIEHNPEVALLFHWREFDRQVRVSGVASKIDRERSLSYWNSRPRASRLAARAASGQTVVESRAALERLFRQQDTRFSGDDVPLPDDWGGYRVVPREFEFWQGRKNRLHDRLVYSHDADDAWSIRRLAP